MNVAESSYFKEDPEMAFAALTLFSEYEKTCSEADKVLKTEIERLIKDYELKLARKK